MNLLLKYYGNGRHEGSVRQAITGEMKFLLFFALCACVAHRNFCSYAAAGPPLAHHGHPAGGACFNQIIEYFIGRCLVEDAGIAKLLQIQLKALQFDTGFAGGIGYEQLAKIRLAGLGTYGGELRTAYLYLVFPL